MAPSLGDKIARLRGTAQAQEKCAFLPAAIHALIMACLARIFGRLEHMVRLWAAGCLPPTQTHRSAPTPSRMATSNTADNAITSRTPATCARHHPPHIEEPTRSVWPAAAIDTRHRNYPRRTASSPTVARSVRPTATSSIARPRRAHDPPPFNLPQIPIRARQNNHALIVAKTQLNSLQQQPRPLPQVI